MLASGTPKLNPIFEVDLNQTDYEAVKDEAEQSYMSGAAEPVLLCWNFVSESNPNILIFYKLQLKLEK